MDQWERKLATRDTNRVVRPFEWGTDWLNSLGFPALPGRRQRQLRGMRFPLRHRSAGRFRPLLLLRTGARLPAGGQPPDLHQPGADSLSGEQYGARPVVPGAQRQGPRRDRPAAVEFGPGRPRGAGEAAESVRHQRPAHDHGLSCRAQAGGDAARRLPRVEQRGPHHPCRPAIGRWICAPASTGCAARATSRVGVLGTSLGSCVAFIAAAHDPRIRMGIFNHVSMYFADVVWTGLSTQNVQQGLHGTRDPGRTAAVLERDQPGQLPGAVAGARSEDAADLGAATTALSCRSTRSRCWRASGSSSLPHKVFNLPCGHYTTGQFPFNLMDGLAMCRFAARNL